MPETPPTAEGWYVGHDFRTVDWDAWRETAPDDRDRALDDAVEFFEELEAAEGDAAVFAVLGHEADLLVLTLRPTMDALERDTRALEGSTFARFTDRTASFVSVTEVSGYVSQSYFEEGEEIDPGIRNYVESKLTPEIPDDGWCSFYPMSKRRLPEDNWYTLSFEERAELMAAHGETGRDHAGDIRQLISAAQGFDDWEWGVTLFADDPTALKDVVYDMRFDEVSARFAEFGPFFVGRRFPPAELPAYMAGEAIAAGDGDAAHGAAGGDDAEADGDEAGAGPGGPPEPDASPAVAGGDSGAIREELDELEVYGGQPHGEDVHARVVYSPAALEELVTAVEELSESFDHYDTHRGTDVYENPEDGPAAVVSRWDTERAADIAAGFLADLPGAEERSTRIAAAAGDGGDTAGSGEDSAPDAAETPATSPDGWGTMGMFYTVKPEHREAFVERFGEVGELLAEMEGHRGTDLLANVEDENDMFIASRWDSREDAMTFFRSEAFTETVSWGRDVLADRPRHVFLA